MLGIPSSSGSGSLPLRAGVSGDSVVASDKASIPELAGDAGLVVDANDPAAFAGQVRRLLESDDLAAILRTRGLERSARWTWDALAREMVRIYEAAVAMRPNDRGVGHV